MAEAFVQGFLANLKLDSNDITLVVTDVGLDRSWTSLDKSVQDGTGQSQSIPGKMSGTMSINGHVDQENLNLLEASLAKTVPVDFTLEISQGIGVADAFYSGMFNKTSFNVSTAADGNWAFSLSGDATNVVFSPFESTP
jgi:hypothetical protein